MDRRIALHNLLKSSNPASCWFQPPDNTKLVYPAIVYKRKHGNINHADNRAYLCKPCYEIKVFDANPDSPFIQWMIENVPGVRYVNHFTSNNLNVEVFEVYW